MGHHVEILCQILDCVYDWTYNIIFPQPPTMHGTYYLVNQSSGGTVRNTVFRDRLGRRAMKISSNPWNESMAQLIHKWCVRHY